MVINKKSLILFTAIAGLLLIMFLVFSFDKNPKTLDGGKDRSGIDYGEISIEKMNDSLIIQTIITNNSKRDLTNIRAKIVLKNKDGKTLCEVDKSISKMIANKSYLLRDIQASKIPISKIHRATLIFEMPYIHVPNTVPSTIIGTYRGLAGPIIAYVPASTDPHSRDIDPFSYRGMNHQISTSVEQEFQINYSSDKTCSFVYKEVYTTIAVETNYQYPHNQFYRDLTISGDIVYFEALDTIIVLKLLAGDSFNFDRIKISIPQYESDQVSKILMFSSGTKNKRTDTYELVKRENLDSTNVPMGISDKDIRSYVVEQLKADIGYLGDKNMLKINQLIQKGDEVINITPDGTEYDMSPNVEGNEYALLSDVDGDGEKELIFLQIEGSGHFSTFCICKHDRTKNKYKVVVNTEMFSGMPLYFRSKLYFIEKQWDSEARRWKQAKVYQISDKMELVCLFGIDIRYRSADDNTPIISD